ncbi:MAG: DUF86 domain-containing protein [Bacteroidetes bacterium]|nr:DUF86 domain-containing protein [Bacteroidota bacterium]
MKNEERTYQMFLEDIQLAMSRIAEYIEGYDFKRFKKDYKTVDAVIRNFEIIGEASRKLDARIKEKYPEIPWQEMYYLRNRVSHEYFGVDYEIIWDIAINYLPANKVQIDSIIEQEK